MAEPVIYNISDIPDDATPEEQMLAWLEEIYKHYDNQENMRLIRDRKNILVEMYRINHDTQITNKENLLNDLYNKYEESLMESTRLARCAEYNDFKTLYYTIHELKCLRQEFIQTWFKHPLDFIDIIEELTDYFNLE